MLGPADLLMRPQSLQLDLPLHNQPHVSAPFQQSQKGVKHPIAMEDPLRARVHLVRLETDERAVHAHALLDGQPLMRLCASSDERNFKVRD
ncbi:hypothetical protein N0V85_003639 [Neurospora sp. IMI 360204]|nr:hypothetical protein N0V85_003639 [Neurospora sp. IMI 360204]